MPTKEKTYNPIPVMGYKEQTQATCDLVNEGKELEERILRYIEKLKLSSHQANSNVTLKLD